MAACPIPCYQNTKSKNNITKENYFKVQISSCFDKSYAIFVAVG
jgi:hypothetical protein